LVFLCVIVLFLIFTSFLVSGVGTPVTRIANQKPVLRSTVASKRRKGMSQEEPKDLWHGAFQELMNQNEIVSSWDR